MEKIYKPGDFVTSNRRIKSTFGDAHYENIFFFTTGMCEIRCLHTKDTLNYTTNLLHHQIPTKFWQIFTETIDTCQEQNISSRHWQVSLAVV